MKKTITAQIEDFAFILLEENPQGLPGSKLNTEIMKINPNFHPKTVNGTVWKLPGKYPDKVLKIDGRYRLVK